MKKQETAENKTINKENNAPNETAPGHAMDKLVFTDKTVGVTLRSMRG